MTRWVDEEITRCFAHRGFKSFDGQFSGSGVDGKNGKAVCVSTIGGVEEFAARRDMDIGAADICCSGVIFPAL